MNNEPDIIRLNWRPLVEAVKRGEYEPCDETGDIAFMYCEKRNTFVSDRESLNHIVYARSHNRPFMLLGELGTGKNVFLELVAVGSQRTPRRECLDENVVGKSEENMLRKFFGRDGLVQQHPGSLFHFDFLQNAVAWPTFMDKLLQLALTGVLHRTDGKAVRGLGIRVVGGATVDLETVTNFDETPELKALYDYLRTSQLARTRRLVDRRDRMEQLLSEALAAQALEDEDLARSPTFQVLEVIPRSLLATLQQYDWTGGFNELVRFVRSSILNGTWLPEAQLQGTGRKPATTVISRKPYDVALSFAGANRDIAKRIAEQLRLRFLTVFYDEYEVAKIWGRDLYQHLSNVYQNQAIYCVILVSKDYAGSLWTNHELKAAQERAFRESKEYILPLRLDDTDIPGILSTTAYVDLRTTSIEAVVEFLVDKVKSREADLES